jgi:hypothetical protein
MDLVAYSKQFMDKGAEYVQELQQIVRQTPAFRAAEKQRELLRLPTGDGMALVFFGDPQTAAQCAIEIGAALQSRPHLSLRMGLNTGPVYRIDDINQARNVSGGGINMAQRVMDAGDAGHILCSKSTADVLQQLAGWAPHMHDLGEQAVKHDVKVHLFNLYTPDVGNSAWPSRLPRPRHIVEEERSRLQTRRALIYSGVGLGALLGGLYAYRALKPVQPELSFYYSITVKRFSDGAELSTASDPAQLMEEGKGIAFTVGSDKRGYLYVLNKGPMADGSLTYIFLSPGPRKPAAFAAGATYRIPEKEWLAFDKSHGEEKLYLVWSEAPIPEIERLKDPLSESDLEQGHVVIKGQQMTALDDFMAKHTVKENQIARNESSAKAVITGRDSVLVRLVLLKHL